MANSIGDVSHAPNPRATDATAVLPKRWRERPLSSFLVLFLVPLILYVAVLPVMPLMEPDEARYALIPQYMNQTGDYITPHLKGVAYLEKPPLAYWATALFFTAFGENAFAARLFAGLCAWGCILLVYNMGCYFHDRKTGLYSAAVLSVSLLLFALGRINILDMPLTLFLCLAIWCGFRFFQSPGMEDKKWRYGCYGFSALAFLTKGVIGVVFPPAVIILWLCCSRRWRDVLRILSPGGILLFALPVGAWLLMVQRANPDFFWFFFIHEHFLRYTTKIHERVEPFWYYLPVVLLGVTPWWAYITQAFMGVRRRRYKLFTGVEMRLFAVWTGFIFLFFSLSSSKLASYIAPVILPLAVLMGRIFAGFENQGGDDDHGEAGRDAPWSLVPAVVQSLALGALMFVPLFVREYREIGPPGGSWLWLVLPVIVAAVILFVPEILRKRVRTGWFASIYLLFAVYLVSLLFPLSHYLTPGKSALDVVRAIKAYVPADAVIFQYRSTMYGIDFYTGRNTPIVEDLGELKYGADRIDRQERERRFPTEEEFVRAVKKVVEKAAAVQKMAVTEPVVMAGNTTEKTTLPVAPGKAKAMRAAGEAGVPTFVVTEGKGHVETLRRSFPAARIVWDNRKFYLLALPQF